MALRIIDTSEEQFCKINCSVIGEPVHIFPTCPRNQFSRNAMGSYLNTGLNINTAGPYTPISNKQTKKKFFDESLDGNMRAQEKCFIHSVSGIIAQ
jgi:hypothetical protein